MGDPVKLNTCEKVIEHGIKSRKGFKDAGTIPTTKEEADTQDATNQFKIAAGHCECEANPLPEWHKGYKAANIGPFGQDKILPNPYVECVPSDV